MRGMTHSQRLAQYLADLEYEGLPRDVIDAAVASIVNALGCALGAAGCPSQLKALQALSYLKKASDLPATVIGRSEQLDIESVALLNGIAFTRRDFDDTHLATVIHPSGAVLAAIFAWGETHGASGKDVILAYVVGVEAQCAIGNAISPGHYDSGWHITGTCGNFGAAAAVAKLLRLGGVEFGYAFGHAATFASGIRCMFGTDSKLFHMGKAAQNGIQAALLAQCGCTSKADGIESWAQLVSTTVDASRICERLLDGKYEILENAWKPYPCGIVIHPVIDACLEVYGKGKRDVKSVLVTVNPLCVKLCNIRHPQNGMETIFSLYHGAACALTFGKAGIAEFSDEACQNTELRAVRDRIQVATDDGIRDDEARVVFKYANSSETVHIDHARGSFKRPLTRVELTAKFIEQATYSIPRGSAEKSLKLAWNLERIDRIDVLLAAVRT